MCCIFETALDFLSFDLDWFHLNRREKRLEAFQTASWFEDLKDNSTRVRLCEEQQVVLNNIAKILGHSYMATSERFAAKITDL